MSQVNLRELAADELDIVGGGYVFGPAAAWAAHVREARLTEALASFCVTWVSPSETARLPTH
jgi:hypothetical protein